MSATSESIQFPKLGDLASPALEEAVVQLVAAKHACDAHARRGDPLARAAGYGLELWEDAYRTPCGVTFFWKTFPFSQSEDSDKGLPAYVPARRTIGDAHRGYSESMPSEQQETTLALLQHSDRTVWGNKECAKYTWIRPLGLFLASEGKNRVSLFQRLGIEWIPACVSTQDYPSPERIEMYMIKDQGLSQCWAALDGRWLEHLANPMWALPVLHAYGVRIEEHWPREFPPLAEVMRAHDEILDDRPGRKPRVDLDVVRARVCWEDERIWVTPLSRLGVKSLWKPAVAWFAAVMVGIVLLISVPTSWVFARLIAAALLGAAAGVLVLAETRLIPLRRKDIQPALGYRWWARSHRSE